MLALETLTKIPHIVLADDDPDECVIFKNALECMNIQYIFSLAENGAMLLNMLDELEFLPDLIFIDLNMKGITGKDCLKAIRSCAKLDDVPVIVYSSLVNYQDLNECYDARANMYVVKSNFIPGLSNLLEAVLQVPVCRLLTIQKEEFVPNKVLA